MTPLNPEETTQAHNEGWDIFEVEGGFELQRCDEARKFPDDTAVWKFVWDLAKIGSELHQKVLNFIQEKAPAEYKDIQEYCHGAA